MYTCAITLAWNSVFLHDTCIPACTAQIWPKGMKTKFWSRVPLDQVQKTLQSSVLQRYLHVLQVIHGEREREVIAGVWTLPNAPRSSSSAWKVLFTCSSCCCSCCNSPGLSGTPSRWRRRKRSVCQHPPTPGDRNGESFKKQSGEIKTRNQTPAKYRL